MTVSRILSTKGRAVTTAPADATMHDVARILTEKKIGAVVITDAAGGVLGILSERDVVHAVAAGGGAALADPAALHMTREVVTTTEDKTIVSVMTQMTRQRFRHMPVTAGGRLAGMLSIGDLVKHRLEEMESEHAAMRDYITSN